MADIPKEMIALRYHAPNDVRLDTVEVPKVRPDDVLVKVRECGICTTDRHIRAHGTWVEETPVTLGHEACLEVVKLGDNVSTDRNHTPIKIGDTVTAEDVVGCGKCYYCNRGWQNLCVKLGIPGITSEEFPGFFSTYQRIHWSAVHKALDGLTDDEVAQAEPAAGALHAVRNGGVKIGDVVVVFGCGPIGLFMVQNSAISGASEVIAVDLVDMKLDVAKKVGADIVLNPTKDKVIDYILDHTDNFGADVVLEAVGKGSLIQDALKIVRKRGTISVMGIVTEGPVPLNIGDPGGVVLKEAIIRGTLGHTFWPDAEADFQVVMKLMKTGRIKVDPLVTHRFKLRDWEAAFDVPSDDQIKVMIDNLE